MPSDYGQLAKTGLFGTGRHRDHDVQHWLVAAGRERLRRPGRLHVIGASDAATAQLITDLHDGVEGPVQTLSIASAEMVKLAANALLATKITFINEIVTVCEATGADVEQVATAIGMDHRLGPHFLKAGLGYGDSCFPKDSRALRPWQATPGTFQLLNSVIEVNDLQPRRAIQRLKTELGGLKGRRIALLGMTFKAGTDDLREAPSAVIAARLLAESAEVHCWDPMARPADVAPWNATVRHSTPGEAMSDADAAIVVTEWPELKTVDWSAAGRSMRRRVLFDGRNVLDPNAMASAGFIYMSVGRATVLPMPSDASSRGGAGDGSPAL